MMTSRRQKINQDDRLDPPDRAILNPGCGQSECRTAVRPVDRGSVDRQQDPERGAEPARRWMDPGMASLSSAARCGRPCAGHTILQDGTSRARMVHAQHICEYHAQPRAGGTVRVVLRCP
jgi:hypothetical protein